MFHVEPLGQARKGVCPTWNRRPESRTEVLYRCFSRYLSHRKKIIVWEVQGHEFKSSLTTALHDPGPISKGINALGCDGGIPYHLTV